MRRPLCVILLAAFITAPLLWSHQSPEHRVEDLSKSLANRGASAKLLIARAYEHQSLGNWSAAAADFNAALELDSHAQSAISGCAEAYFHLGNLDQAESMCQRGLALTGKPAEKAPYHALRARIMTRKNNLPEAWDAWQEALKSPLPQVDWFLEEAKVLAMLGRSGKRVKALAQAIERNPSVAIRRAWIRALVDAGEFETASMEIEQGLHQSHWQSSWLLLRAQIHGQKRNYNEQRADAATALVEIESRLSPHHPDPYLLVDAAKALTFMGKSDQALDYQNKARSLGVPEADL